MASDIPKVGNLIVDAFRTSQSRHSTLAVQWIAASHKAGGKLPASAVSASIQRLGDLDLLCRTMEDELSQDPQMTGDPRFHYLMLLSDLWVGSAYAICFAFSSRGLFAADQQFEAISEDLRLIRVQIEKHEIASDRMLAEPLDMVTAPGQGSIRSFRYDKSDPLKAHIGRFGQSERKSAMWEVIDLKGNTMRWLERRSLADRMIDVLSK
jgi:hypothetical protein